MNGTYTQKEIDKIGERFWLEQFSLLGKIKWRLFDKHILKIKNKRKHQTKEE